MDNSDTQGPCDEGEILVLDEFDQASRINEENKVLIVYFDSVKVPNASIMVVVTRINYCLKTNAIAKLGMI